MRKFLYKRFLVFLLVIAVVLQLSLPSIAAASEINKLYESNIRFAAVDDTTSPRVLDTIPTKNSTGVGISTDITIKFSETLQQTSLANVTLRDSGGNNKSIYSRVSGDTIIIDPYYDLEYNTTYTVSIPAESVRDSAGNILYSNYMFSFTTKNEETSPTVASTVPSNWDYDVIIGAPINIKFSEDIQRGDYFNSISLKDSNDNNIRINPIINKDTITINPYNVLSYDTRYTVNIPSGAIKDMPGNNLQYSYTLNFRTAQRKQTPSVTSTYPGGGAVNVSVNETIKVYFNMKIEKGDMFEEITLKDSKGNIIPRTLNITETQYITELTIKPSSDGGKFKSGEKYTVTIPYGAVRDKDTKKLINYDTYTFNFTAAIEGTSPKAVEPTSPQKGAKDVPLDSIITIKFDEEIQEGSYYYYNNISVRDENGRYLEFKASIDKDTLVITPESNLIRNTIYSVNIFQGAVKDLAGNPSEDYTFAFKTGTDIKVTEVFPTVISTSPGNENKFIPVNMPVNLTFNEAIYLVDDGKNITLKSDKGNITVNITANSNVLTIKPINNLNLLYDTKYTVNIPVGVVKNQTGKTLKSNYSLSFTTESQSSFPRIKSVIPNNGDRDIEISNSIYIQYYDGITKGKNFDNITLKDENGDKVEIVFGIDQNKLWITPYNILKTNSKYSVDIPAGALGGWTGYDIRPSTEGYSFTFSTGGDRKYPYVKDISPESGVENASIDGGIIVAFSESFEKGDTFDKITLRETESGKNIGIVSTIEDNILNIKLKDNLNFGFNTSYTFEIPQGAVKDVSGNQLIYGYIYSFKTGDQNSALQVVNTDPKNDEKNVAVYDNIIVAFNELVKRGYNIEKISVKDDKGNRVKVSSSTENYKLVINPLSNLNYSTRYTVEIPTGAVKKLSSGDILRNSHSFSFTTEQEKIPPKLKSINPSGGATSVAVDTSITVTFDENIQGGDSFNYIVLTNQNGVAVSSSMSIKGNTLIIKPGRNLDYNSTYITEIPAGAIKDAVGNKTEYEYKYAFKTEIEKNPPKAILITPANGTRNVSTTSLVTIMFDKNVKPGDRIGSVSIKDGAGKSIAASLGINRATLTIKPKARLTNNTVYTVSIPSGSVKDASGNLQKDSYTFKFMTDNPLGVKSGVLSKDNKEITITFNQNVMKGTDFRKVILNGPKGNTVRITTKLVGSVLTITPKEDLAGSTRYTVVVPAGAIKDSQYKANEREMKINFTTYK